MSAKIGQYAHVFLLFCLKKVNHAGFGSIVLKKSCGMLGVWCIKKGQSLLVMAWIGPFFEWC